MPTPFPLPTGPFCNEPFGSQPEPGAQLLAAILRPPPGEVPEGWAESTLNPCVHAPRRTLEPELEPGVSGWASKEGVQTKGSRPSHLSVPFVPRASGFFSLSVDIPTVSDLHYGHRPGIVVNFEEDSEVTLPKSISLPSGEFFTRPGSWSLGEVLDSADDATPVLCLEILQFLYRRRFDPWIIVCHGASNL